MPRHGAAGSGRHHARSTPTPQPDRIGGLISSRDMQEEELVTIHDRRYLDLYRAALSGRLSRRDVLRRATALGLSMPAVAALLAACGGGDGDGETATTSGETVTTPTEAA